MGSIYVPKTIAQILKEVATIDDFSRKTMILEFHLQAMEEEGRRIEGFKCYVPQTTHLLEDAREILKLEFLRLKRIEMGPMKDEFMQLPEPAPAPETMEREKERNNEFEERKEWMRSVQLWTDPVLENENGSHSSTRENDRDTVLHPISGLKKAVPKDKGVASSSSSMDSIDLNVTAEWEEPPRHSQQKKQRRCWSPELHTKFVHALHQLGGEESATPKQIREVMKVEGLTNDEVKSHLQKYRLHIRKLPISSSSSQVNGS